MEDLTLHHAATLMRREQVSAGRTCLHDSHDYDIRGVCLKAHVWHPYAMLCMLRVNDMSYCTFTATIANTAQLESDQQQKEILQHVEQVHKY